MQLHCQLAAGAISGRTSAVGVAVWLHWLRKQLFPLQQLLTEKTSTKNALCEIIITFYANSTTLCSLSLSLSLRVCVCVCGVGDCVHICMMPRMWADEVGMSVPLASTPWLGNFRCAVCLIKAANANKNANKF